jgi:hypothetical protein
MVDAYLTGCLAPCVNHDLCDYGDYREEGGVGITFLRGRSMVCCRDVLCGGGMPRAETCNRASLRDTDAGHIFRPYRMDVVWAFYRYEIPGGISRFEFEGFECV